MVEKTMLEAAGERSLGISVNPPYLLIIIIASIFSAEALVMVILSIAPPLPLHTFVLLDSLILTVTLFPVLYYLVFKPLRTHIAERKASEMALQVSEDKYRSLVETTDDSVYLVNEKCEYLFMNSKHRTRMGFVGDGYLGKSYGEYHPTEEATSFAEMIRKVISSREPMQHEHKSQRDDRYFLRTLSPVKNPGGEVTAVSVISKNITALKHAEIARDKLVAELREAIEKIKTLKGLIPVCAWCKKVRDDKGYWNELHMYIREHTDADFTHSICTDCLEQLRGEEEEKKD